MTRNTYGDALDDGLDIMEREDASFYSGLDLVSRTDDLDDMIPDDEAWGDLFDDPDLLADEDGDDW